MFLYYSPSQSICFHINGCCCYSSIQSYCEMTLALVNAEVVTTVYSYSVAGDIVAAVIKTKIVNGRNLLN